MKKLLKKLLFCLLTLIVVIILFGLILSFLPSPLKVHHQGISPEKAAGLRADFSGLHHTFTTSDGETLFLRRWDPDTIEACKQDIAVLIFHGLTAHSGAYEMAALPLSEGGFTTFGLDYRGHGLSDGNRGDSPDKERWIADLVESVEYVKSLGFKRVVVLGHSLGVAAAMCVADAIPEEIGGVVLLSGAYEGKTGSAVDQMSFFQKMQIIASSIFRPNHQVYEYYRDDMTGIDDPLFNYKYTLRFLSMLDVKQLRLPENLNAPVLVGVGDQDELFDVEKVREFYDLIPGNNKEFLIWKGAKHAEIGREHWEQIVEWLNSHNKNEKDVLWYRHPAKDWNEALPLGNGKLGVMVFGNTSNERIQLNDDSMWPANNSDWNEPEGDKEDIDNIRKLLFEGKNDEADQLFVEKFSRKGILRSHQTMGDLFIEFNNPNITDYRRELDISSAVATISYRSGGDLISEKVFVSHPHKAVVIQLSSQKKEGLNAKLRLSRPEDNRHPTAKTFTGKNDLLIMQGEVTQHNGSFNSEPFPLLEGIKFETCLKVANEGGKLHAGEDFLELQNVRKATLYLVSNSSYYFEDYEKQNEADLEKISSSSYEALENEHIKDYQSLYDRCQIQLTDIQPDTIPTDQRIQNIKNGETDIGLEALLFQFGRYLLISSSREGTNPANLQGLWNEHIEAPWNADYHLNINLQMNYWLANVTNLGELNNPLFDFIDRLVENGKVTARKNFGCEGTFFPHATDLWAPAWLRAATAYWGCSVGAGGWLMQHYWQYYEFTLDETFLRERAFPAIQEVARFYSDWIIEDPRDGTLVSAPSTSPENRFYLEKDKAVATCLGSAMDQQIIHEVFTNYLKACEILQIENDFTEKVRKQLQQLRPGFVLGPDGRILEWDRPYEEPEPGHRHMSHLYGFHPGNIITKEKNPDMFEAVRKTLDYRLEHGGAGTGWSRAWLINCSARLLDGEMAHEHIQLLFKKSISNNLFDMHPPFQIDGNFGYTAGVAEMLIQSHEDNIIRILPALPESWEKGFVRGLKARGGLTFDIFWSNNVLEKIKIKSESDRTFNLIYADEKIPVRMKKGEIYVYKHKPG